MNKPVKNGQWKVDVNNKLSKLLRDSKKASEIYKLLNPFVVALPSN